MSVAAVLAPQAAIELREALDWLAGANLDAAFDLNDAITVAAHRIGRNPSLGARRPWLAGDAYRFWPTRKFPYLLVYTDRTKPPRILRALHMSRDLPPLLGNLADFR